MFGTRVKACPPEKPKTVKFVDIQCQVSPHCLDRGTAPRYTVLPALHTVPAMSFEARCTL